MGNRYLEEMFPEPETASNKERGSYEVLGGAYVGSKTKVLESTLGYDTLYHGTTKDNAASIKMHGFDPRKGGTNNAAVLDMYNTLSKNKNHFTKSLYTANLYAGGMDRHGFDFSSIAKERRENGEVLKVRVPSRTYKHFQEDHTASFGDGKDSASTTGRYISSKHVSGGKDSKGILEFINKKHLGSYYHSNENKVRALKGLGLATAGAALVAHGIHTFKKKD